MENDTEYALRHHIRELLLDYALTYLTTNYVTYTQNSVTDVLSDCLKPVSTADPTALALQPTLHDAISNFVEAHAHKLQSYDEVLVLTPETMDYIKSALKHSKGPPPSLRCWDCESTLFAAKFDLHRPMSPILTAKARRETPSFGSGRDRLDNMCSSSTKRMITKFKMQSIEPEEFAEIPPMDLNDVLDLRLPVESDVHLSTMQLIQSIPRNTRNVTPATENSLTEEFIRLDSPPLDTIGLDSPPIFSRDRKPGGSTGLQTKLDISKICEMIPHKTLEVEDDMEDLYKEHMVVVNGWQCYEAPSSPLNAPTPSLASCSSQVDTDELLPSSPRPYFFQRLLDAKMDDYEIPRTEKIGGARTQASMLGQCHGLSAFLRPLIHADPTIRVITTPKSHSSSPRTLIPESMLGQPPSLLGNSDVELLISRRTLDGSDDELDEVLKMFGAEHTGNILDRNPLEIILNERLDEKDGLLMDLPKLPEPTEHPPSLKLSTSLRNLVNSSAPSNVSPTQVSQRTTPYEGFLRKVKGVASLNIELIWRPFDWKGSIPTNEEVSYTAQSVRLDLVPHLLEEDPKSEEILTALLQESFEPSGNEESSTSYANWKAESEIAWNTSIFEEDEYVLTRAERRRAQGLPAIENFITEEDSIEEEASVTSCFHSPGPDSFRSKRPRLEETCENDIQLKPDESRYIQTGEETAFQASGVYFFDPAHGEQEHYFTNLEQEYLHLPVDDEGTDDANTQSGSLYFHENMDPPILAQHLHQDYDGEYSNSHAEVDMDEQGFLPLSFESTQRATWNTVNELDHGLETEETQGLEIQEIAREDASSFLSYADSVPMEPIGGPSSTVIVITPTIAAKPSGVTGNLENAALVPPPTVSALLGVSTASTFFSGNNPPISGPPTSNYQQRQGLHEYSTASHRHQEQISGSKLLSTFLTLRSKALSHPQLKTFADPSSPELHPQSPPEANESKNETIIIPENLIDASTLPHPPHVSDEINIPHKYLVSSSLLNKRRLLHVLASPFMDITLVDSPTPFTEGHIIFDPSSCLIFYPMSSLPAPGKIEELMETVGRLNNRHGFDNVFVLWECFGEGEYWVLDENNCAGDEEVEGVKLNPFSPPVIKALKKFKRDLAIAEACTATMMVNNDGKGESATAVQGALSVKYAFALTVSEAAKYVRQFGDLSEEMWRARDDVGGVVWDAPRVWLGDHEDVDMDDSYFQLSSIPPFNPFTATLILSQTNLDDFLDMDFIERVQLFGPLVGTEKMNDFNRILQRRSEAMQLPSSSPTTFLMSSQ
ncbi:hypothetical protein ABKN59_005052 [Abortiporus biennis]